MTQTPKITFFRNTHRNTAPRADLPQGAGVWTRHGLIGHLLESERGQDLAELAAAVWSYQGQNHEPRSTLPEILDGLSALVDADFARAEIAA